MNSSLYNDRFYDKQSKESFDSALIVLTKLRQQLSDNIELSSVVDFGCGVGSWLAAAKEVGFNTVIGTDGDYVSREKLMVKEHEFIPNDLSKPSEIKLPIEKCDLAITLEVAEHLPEVAADDFVSKLTSMSDVVLFSAAIPYQGGHGHINENWLEYWEVKFKNNGYIAIDLLRPALWRNKEVCWWYRQNLIVFIKRENLNLLPVGTRINQPLSIIHPEQYLVAVHREKTNRNFSLNQDLKYLNNIKNKCDIKPNTYGQEYSYTEEEHQTLNTVEELKAYAEKTNDAVLLDVIYPIKRINFDLNTFKASILPRHKFPDFLCIGAQKAGTTWLYEVMKQQTSIWMPPLKELNFFNQLLFENNSACSGFWRREAALKRLHQAAANPNVDDQWLGFLFHLCKKGVDIDWYSDIFNRCPIGRISGEITPEYMLLPIEGIRAIKALNPNVKIILILRHPLERIKSHLKMIKGRCPNINDSLLASLAQNESVLFRSSGYDKLVQNWLNVFDRDQLFISDYDSLDKSPSDFFKKLETFLGVNLKNDIPIFNKRIHVSSQNNEPFPINLEKLDEQYQLVNSWQKVDFDF